MHKGHLVHHFLPSCPPFFEALVHCLLGRSDLLQQLYIIIIIIEEEGEEGGKKEPQIKRERISNLDLQERIDIKTRRKGFLRGRVEGGDGEPSVSHVLVSPR